MVPPSALSRSNERIKQSVHLSCCSPIVSVFNVSAVIEISYRCSYGSTLSTILNTILSTVAVVPTSLYLDRQRDTYL